MSRGKGGDWGGAEGRKGISEEQREGKVIWKEKREGRE
jgi:hypothetical protein